MRKMLLFSAALCLTCINPQESHWKSTAPLLSRTFLFLHFLHRHLVLQWGYLTSTGVRVERPGRSLPKWRGVLNLWTLRPGVSELDSAFWTLRTDSAAASGSCQKTWPKNFLEVLCVCHGDMAWASCEGVSYLRTYWKKRKVVHLPVWREIPKNSLAEWLHLQHQLKIFR